MIELIWPNGEITTGKTWREAEEAARAAQWSPYKTRSEFRREMRRRAEVWSGERVKTGGSSEAFMRGLGEVNMFMIVEEDEER